MSAPNPAVGEVSVKIDGKDEIIKFSFEAQEKIAEELDLDDIVKIPSLMQNLTPNLICTILSHTLVSMEATKEDLFKCFIPTALAGMSIIKGINLATFGNENGPQEVIEDNPLEQTQH